MPDPLPFAEVVPLELGGQWIAWDDAGLKIIASGDSAEAATAAAKAAGVAEPIIEKAPPADSGFVGRL
ncbi:hypothetical protein [Lacipirellula parvula]|uniref:DUF5678 domain-containing protein n=1 Tax=Lacipirellula parvula TaxID=2650471 RepID=A0A5K7XJD2_9BACT|nr:hypothetical protein [Lacipirellula parvula]BBO32979.1 hypothetical protein PLANPX_2591 [Lacipirellula parvula]